jgi:nucleoside-diphosphate kinase
MFSFVIKRIMSNELMKERTVILVKPDGVKRGLVGEIIARFEKAGLKIIAAKMIWIDTDMAAKHYPDARTELLEGMGKKTLLTYEKYGKDANEELGTMEPLAIGRMINSWNMDFLTSGPVMAMLLEGVHAIDNVRMIAGNTLPAFAEPGTIRGDYSIDSPALANANKRAVRNMVHASGNPEEAKYEAELWFHESEIYDYRRTDEEVMFEGK